MHYFHFTLKKISHLKEHVGGSYIKYQNIPYLACFDT